MRIFYQADFSSSTDFEKQGSWNELYMPITVYTLAYVFLNISLGICLGEFIGLAGISQRVTFRTPFAVFCIWILISIAVHPLIKLIRGRRDFFATASVFLITMSTLHTIAIPTTTILGGLVSETRVTLTYDYTIYLGVTRSATERKSSFYTFAVQNNTETYIAVQNNTETYIKEEEPKKEGTVLPPLKEEEIIKDVIRKELIEQGVKERIERDIYDFDLTKKDQKELAKEWFENYVENKYITEKNDYLLKNRRKLLNQINQSVERIPIEEIEYEAPQKTETIELKSERIGVVVIYSIAYYIVCTFYLAMGMSEVHGISVRATALLAGALAISFHLMIISSLLLTK